MEKKKSWDDIPSLEGLDVDWEYKSATSLDKRSYVRIPNKDICKLCEVKEIVVKVATAEQTFTGHLVDISEGGLAITLSVLLEEKLEEETPVKLGFFLGTVKIISKALVRHTRKEGAVYMTGIQFVDLGNESAEYIRGFRVSANLRSTF